MLPSSPFPGSQQNSLYTSSQSLSNLAFSDVPGGLIGSQSFSSQSSLQTPSSVDANSPEAFKQAIQLALGQAARVQDLARSALAGIENAYHPGTNPFQTTADMTALQQAMQMLAELLRQTGVGALPLHPPDLAQPPTEDQLIAETTVAVQALYERSKRVQESAGVVASLLSVSDAARR
ncbi:hypothetical protein IEO21_06564 [Rhodonia placenta]|uniref:Uncharacterized protein n=2 Tax=Rhodonia placenta TaxID=104341 RepID=A0A1X6N1E9_9APHY|nr:hypothetical protein POSPLADRAFT_1074473 [Postia placenta MAD-698-R-SB12]KAF9811513.1 hypothetical protein IEO21_06564 [Postia placenta]OSX62283.1 hypothetical protein POSPLADRAFT_1074473 [Postia placenta MAD-698-R-SB12]